MTREISPAKETHPTPQQRLAKHMNSTNLIIHHQNHLRTKHWWESMVTDVLQVMLCMKDLKDLMTDMPISHSCMYKHFKVYHFFSLQEASIETARKKNAI